MRKLLHERKFHKEGETYQCNGASYKGAGTSTGYKIYDDGFVEFFSGNNCKGTDAIPWHIVASGTLVEQVNGRFPKYNAHQTLGFHESSMLKFTIYGKEYRFYTRVIAGMMGKYNEVLDTIKGKKRKQEYMALAIKAVHEAE